MKNLIFLPSILIPFQELYTLQVHYSIALHKVRINRIFWTPEDPQVSWNGPALRKPLLPACSSRQIAFPVSSAISSCLLSLCAHTRSPHRHLEICLLPTLATLLLRSAGSDTPLCLPLPPCCLTLTHGLVSGAGILSLLWKWEPAQPSKLTECPKTHSASHADTPLTTCDDRDVLLSVILTRSRSLYLPAHPPGHLSPKIVCTLLARILSLPCWGAHPCMAWLLPVGEDEGAPCQLGCSTRRRWEGEGSRESSGSLLGFGSSEATGGHFS